MNLVLLGRATAASAWASIGKVEPCDGDACWGSGAPRRRGRRPRAGGQERHSGRGGAAGARRHLLGGAAEVDDERLPAIGKKQSNHFLGTHFLRVKEVGSLRAISCIRRQRRLASD